MKKECKIVQDLLPNYLEKVTNPETNEFIEEHLKSCEECKKTYSSMQYDMNVEKIDTKEEVKYMKKFKKQLRILRNILLVIIVVFVIVIARKAIILTNLRNATKKYYNEDNYKVVDDYYMNLNNYHAKLVICQEKVFSVMEAYYKDGNKLATLDIYYYEEGGKHIKIIDYYKNGEKIMLEHDVTNNIVSKTETGVNMNLQTTDVLYTLGEYLKELVFASISKINFNGTECYLIKSNNEERVVDIKTGTIKRVIANDKDVTTNCYFEFGTVTDEDIKRPEIE